MRWQHYRKEIRETVQLSLPIIIGQLGLVLMGVADTVQVGVLGAAPVAASGFVNSVFWVVCIVGIGSMMVIGPQVATAKAQGNANECGRILQSGLLLGFGWGLAITLVFTGLVFHFHWFGQKPDVLALSGQYGYLIAASALPMMLFSSMRQFTDGLSYTRVTMAVTLGGLLLNVVLNWLLIDGKLGMPALGLNGAGVATLLSRTAMAAGLGLCIFKGTVFKPFIRPVAGGPLKPLLLKLTRLGLPGGLQLFFEIAAFSGATVMAGWLGTMQQAAHAVALNMASVSYMMAAGISSAGAIRVGQFMALRSRAGIVRAGTTALVLSVAFMVCTCLVFMLFPRFLAGLYNTEGPVIVYAVSLLAIAGLFQLSDGVQVVCLGILRGIADVNVPTYITLVAYWVIGLPMAYVFAFPLGMDVQGIWYGLSLGLTVSALLLLARFYRLTTDSGFEFKDVPQPVLHG